MSGIKTVLVSWTKENGRWKMAEIPGTEKVCLITQGNDRALIGVEYALSSLVSTRTSLFSLIDL